MHLHFFLAAIVATSYAAPVTKRLDTSSATDAVKNVETVTDGVDTDSTAKKRQISDPFGSLPLNFSLPSIPTGTQRRADNPITGLLGKITGGEGGEPEGESQTGSSTAKRADSAVDVDSLTSEVPEADTSSIDTSSLPVRSDDPIKEIMDGVLGSEDSSSSGAPSKRDDDPIKDIMDGLLGSEDSSSNGAPSKRDDDPIKDIMDSVLGAEDSSSSSAPSRRDDDPIGEIMDSLLGEQGSKTAASS